MQRFLVMMKEGLHLGRRDAAFHSSKFPVLVEIEDAVLATTERILLTAFRQRGWDEYKNIGSTFLVFPISTVLEVSIDPKQGYEINAKHYEFGNE